MSQPRKTMESDQVMHGLSSTIPGEIVEDILFRLPVKSLLRFKCVSKPWYSLLSSKNFVKTHLEKSANNISLAYPEFFEDSDQPNHAYCSLNLCSLRSLFHETDGAESVVHGLDDPLTFYTSPRTNVVGYANGLCCICEDAEKMILWNPATKKSQKLPLVYEEELLWIDGVIRGFGFDESTDDYKFLAVVRTPTHPPRSGCCSSKFMLRLYSLRTNSWKTLESSLVFGAFEGSGVLVSGKLHWAAHTRTDSGIRLDIVSFDLGSEAVGPVEPPSSVDGYHLCPALSVLGGCLSVLCGNKKNGTDIWVMKEYGVTESWCKLMTVATCADLETYGHPYQKFTPLCISPEGEVLLFRGSSLMIYNPKEKSFRTPRMDIKLPPYNAVGFYCESLVSPLLDNE